MLYGITPYADGMIGIGYDELREAVEKANKDWNLDDDGVYLRDEDNFDLIQSLLPGEDWLWIESDQCEQLQFTGLKDKNSKDVYEGDIIKWPIGYNNFSSLTMYVGYNELGMRLYKRLPCDCCGGHKGGSIPSFGIFKKCEVIGNIYENPELLK